jgi:hypothetical protein
MLSRLGSAVDTMALSVATRPTIARAITPRRTIIYRPFA